jgi:tetratricopeptide (TPR) repeat protein
MAAAFFAVSSFSIFYAQEARPYSLYALLSLSSFFFLYRALRHNRAADWLVYVVCVGASMMTHLFTLFIIIGQIVFVVMGLSVRFIAPQRAALFRKITRRALAGVGLAVVLAFALLALTPYFYFVFNSARNFGEFLLSPSIAPPEQWSGIAPGESPPLLTFDFFYHRILENFSGSGITATTLFVALGLSGAIARIRSKSWETILLLAWVLVPTMLIVVFLIQRATLFAARYLIFALPPWLVLCACGAVAIAEALRRMLGAITTVAQSPRVRQFAIALVAGIWLAVSLGRAAEAIGVPKENWRDAGNFLEANVRAGDAVIAPGGGFVIFYYTPHAVQQRVDADVAAQISGVEAHAARVWLVFDRYVFDPGAEITAWLQSRGAVEIHVDDAVQIYYWRKSATHDALLDDVKALALPNTASTYAALGEQFAYAGDVETGVEYYQRGLTLANTRSEQRELFTGLGDIYRRANDAPDASKAYREAIGRDESNAVDAYVGLARVYLGQNQLAAAYDALQRALTLDPNSYPAILFLADYYERAGQADAAQQTYAHAAELVPELTTPP